MIAAQIVGSFYPAWAHGGPIESNRALCRVLAELGAEISVLTTNTDGAAKLLREFRGWRELDGYRVFYGNRWLWRDLSPALAREIRRCVPGSDVVHATGTYNWFLPLVAGACRRAGTPLVLSPRGSLVPEARRSKAWKKRLLDALAQDRALRCVTAFHATSDAEAVAIREMVPGSRVTVIPNGVDVPEAAPERDLAAAPYVLYLGRLHPYKRVERIIAGFAQAVMQGRFGVEGKTGDGRPESRTSLDGDGRQAAGEAPQRADAWSLVIAGDGDAAYRRGLGLVATQVGMGERVRFAGQVSGEEKARLLAQAEGVVLGSFSENFGMSVAEALAHGTPCVVTKTAPWEGLDREGCGFWVDDSEEALAAGMQRLMALSAEERRAMGMRGRAWMRREFSWDSVARRMLALYREVLSVSAS